MVVSGGHLPLILEIFNSFKITNPFAADIYLMLPRAQNSGAPLRNSQRWQTHHLLSITASKLTNYELKCLSGVYGLLGIDFIDELYKLIHCLFLFHHFVSVDNISNSLWAIFHDCG